MYLNGIDFPNHIIDAIEKKKLVVFAGAGVSVDKPTSLPNFENLAKEIAEGTGETLGKKESCEVFLGNLKAKGIDVNQQVSNILSGTCLNHNKLHETIVDLFDACEDIKIVTTNYDQMFEHVISDRGKKVDVYNVPALPLGNDINGIIHIHGNVDNPKYMVVTDEDFGRAYLTEGYASKFLVQLFSSYTVLFIGYSYNDTILRYLTRAILREDNKRLYILTDDQKVNWSVLGISPIYFRKRSFVQMREGLSKLGLNSKKGLYDWKLQFDILRSNPPKDLTGDTEIEYCLENIERSKVLANSVRGKEWLAFLDSKNVFATCFSDNVDYSEETELWTQWLCENFVGKDDDSLLFLIYKYKNKLSKTFAETLLRRLVDYKETNVEYLKKYLLELDKYLFDSWTITNLIEIFAEMDEYYSAFLLLTKLFQFNMVLEKKSWITPDKIEYKHSFIGDYYSIDRAWLIIKDKAIEYISEEVILFVFEKINELHQKYKMAGQVSKDIEPYEMSMIVIEEREENYRDNPIEILSEMVVQTSTAIEKDKTDFLRNILIYGVNSESELLKKISLKTIRVTEVFNASDQLQLLLECNLIFNCFCREQVFLLAANFFSRLDLNKQDTFLTAIETIQEDNDRSSIYNVYNWCIWLQKYNPKNKRIKKIIKDILSENDFKPREHPELIMWSSSAKWKHNQSPFSQEEFVRLPIKQAIIKLSDYNENQFEGPTRYDLLKMFSTCISKNIEWAKRIAQGLVERHISKQDVWQHLFHGLKNADCNLDQVLGVFDIIRRNAGIITDTNAASEYLWNMLQRPDMKDFFLEHEESIYGVTEVLWNQRTDEKKEFSRPVDAALNTTVGNILFSWIHLTSFFDMRSIPEKYIKCFDEALSLKSWEREISICILVGHFNFFCYRNVEWSSTKLLPYLTGNNKTFYVNAWEGMVYFSGRINKDTADILSPVYLKAIKHIEWLEGDSERGFMELLLTLLLYVIDKPTLKYIPELYRNASSSKITLFIETIKHRLKSMDSEQKINWWNSWLKHFLENRKCNKPLFLEEQENQAIMDLIPVLPELFDDIVDITCKGKIANKLKWPFWKNLADIHVSKEHSNSMAKLLIKVLEAEEGTPHGDKYIREIVSEMSKLDQKGKKSLQEVLLKRNIIIELS